MKRIEAIREHYHFTEWIKPEDNLPVQSNKKEFLVIHADLKEYVFIKRQAFSGLRGAYMDFFQHYNNSKARIALTIISFPSIVDAKEGLIRELENIMTPDVPFLKDSGLNIGDIGLGFIEKYTIFSRGHIMVKIANIGEQAVNLKEFAEAIEKQILDFINH